MARWNDLVDRLVELPIVTSFSSIGPAVRSRTDRWDDVTLHDLTGRRVAITGATSGLGLAAARTLSAMGATVLVVGRDQRKTEEVASDLSAVPVVADMGELDQVRAAAATILEAGGVDTLVHNAGALLPDRHTTSAGIEVTIASQVVGPHLLTTLLLPSLSPGGRVITMASGGMYAAGLTVSGLEMSVDAYDGTKQYAIAKRAQVTMNEIWATRVDDVVFHAMHPGWADTPGVEAALPTFRKLTGPILRSPDQGADTLVFLVADDEALRSSSGFWLDRRKRSIHKLPSTRRTDTPRRRQALWERVEELAGLSVDQ